MKQASRSWFQRAVGILVSLSFVGCQLRLPSVSVGTSDSVERLAAIISSHPEALVGLSAMAGGSRTLTEDDPQLETILDAETAAALDQLQNSPADVFATIAAEEQGEQEIELLVAIYEQADTESLSDALSAFLTDEQLAEYQDQVGEAQSQITERWESRGLTDTQLHIMVGASAALLAAAIAYKLVPWYTPWVKAALLAGIGVSAAVAFGALKEAMDLLGFGTREWRDFFNTLAGGAVAGVAIFGMTCLLTAASAHPVVAFLMFGVAGVALGIPVGVSLITTALSKLRGA